MSSEDGLWFVPSRVEGLPDVTEAVVAPDRLILLSRGRWASVSFAEIAHWPRPTRLRRWLAQLGWRPCWLPVGEHDGFHPPSARFFRFFTRPPIVVSLADEPRDRDYGSTLFARVRNVLREGGFHTWDLG